MNTAAARVSALAIVAICVVFAVVGPARPAGYVFEDHRVDTLTVRHMEAGQSYYRAMDGAMRTVGVGPVHESRSFRMPTIFLVWRWLPGHPPASLWIPFVAMVGITGLLLTGYTTAPLVVPLVVLYLLGTGRNVYSGIYLMVEFWVAPFTAATLLSWRRGRGRLAPLFAFLATVVRELAGGLLVGGLFEAVRRREGRLRWALALAAALAAIGVHWAQASQYLVAHGHEAPLLGTSRFPESFLGALGFNLPGPNVVWLPVWGLAVANLVRRRELLPVAFYVTLPLIAFWIHRPYWQLLTIPFVLVWAAELVADVGSAALARRRGRLPVTGAAATPVSRSGG